MLKTAGDISVEEAAKLLGINPTALRVRMQKGWYPEIGFAAQTDSPVSPYNPRKRFRYVLYRAGVENLLKSLSLPAET